LENRNIRYTVVHQQLKVQQISNRSATSATLLSINNLRHKSATFWPFLPANPHFHPPRRP